MVPPGNVTFRVFELEEGDGSEPIKLFAEEIGPTTVTSGSTVIGYTFAGSFNWEESHKISRLLPFNVYGLIQEVLFPEAS